MCLRILSGKVEFTKPDVSLRLSPNESEISSVSRDAARSAFEYWSIAKHRIQSTHAAFPQKPTYLPVRFQHFPQLVMSPDLNNNLRSDLGLYLSSDISSGSVYTRSALPTSPLSPFPLSPSLLSPTGTVLHGFDNRFSFDSFNIWNSFLKSDYSCLYKNKLSPTSPYHPYAFSSGPKDQYSKELHNAEKTIKTEFSAQQYNGSAKSYPKSPVCVSKDVSFFRCIGKFGKEVSQ